MKTRESTKHIYASTLRLDEVYKRHEMQQH